MEAALGITVGFDMALAGASLAFMARRLSADIIKWAARKLQPSREKLERLKGGQVHSPVPWLFSALNTDGLGLLNSSLCTAQGLDLRA